MPQSQKDCRALINMTWTGWLLWLMKVFDARAPAPGFSSHSSGTAVFKAPVVDTASTYYVIATLVDPPNLSEVLDITVHPAAAGPETLESKGPTSPS